MPLQGVSAGAQQGSLFNSQSGTQAAQQSAKSGESEGGGGVQQKIATKVAADAQEQQGQKALQLIKSSQGLGQNVDITA
ncbi:MAG: hypothetical protein ABEJ65_06910 [bacterium]